MQVTELFDKPLSLVSAPRRIAAPANGAAASAAVSYTHLTLPTNSRV